MRLLNTFKQIANRNKAITHLRMVILLVAVVFCLFSESDTLCTFIILKGAGLLLLWWGVKTIDLGDEEV